ncbi:hypothetical protein [Corynebacterium doosanense]|uniref:Uncharacterized protein n=1 Tax=Corynebacterium doosanense CAU 212 = DSM 45436 TaxID=558173 RepID=A0A097IJB2_9CORY|nr:hypothetical protein [Corynebacterium doosanense]AIT62209.1 hypothetical protein CDOO_02735 [Corynebacterium doosanense CAU 212 = DSM 45436]
MPIITLTENASETVEAHSPIHIEAAPAPGYSTNVRLELQGDARANDAGASAVRLLTGTGLIKIVVKPLRGDEFGPETTVRVSAVRGRPGTPQATGVEFEPVTLDGRSDTVIGTLSYEGDRLVIESVSGTGRGETPFDGAAATLRAGLRANLGRRNLTGVVTPGTPTVLALDSSASLSSLATEEDMSLAADILIGIAGALNPDAPFEVSTENSSRPDLIDSREDLKAAALRALTAGAHRVGSGVRREAGVPGRPSFAISDEEPYGVEPHGLTIVIGKGAREGSRSATDTPGVLRVTEELAQEIRENSPRLDEVYSHIVESCAGDARTGEGIYR